MEPGSDLFAVFASYWPSSAALFWWEHFDALEVRRDFEAAAALGLRNLTIALTWNDFQPDRERVSVSAMRSLERVLDTAEAHRLSLLLTLFPVRIFSLVTLPAWALAIGPESGRPVLSGHHLSRRRAEDLFHDPSMLQAEARLVHETVGAFADHPSVSGWILGDRVTAASQPASAEGFEEWVGMLAEEARSSGRVPPLWHGISAHDLVRSPLIDPSAVGRLGVRPLVVADWEAPWAGEGYAWWIAFLAAFATRLSGSPAPVAGIGFCTQENGSAGPSSCVDESRAARAADEALTRAREAGASACGAASLLDYQQELRRSPPFSSDLTDLTRGLLRPNLAPKEAAEVWSAYARSEHPVLPVPARFPSPDPEERQRDPESVARECFEAFMRC